MDLLSTIGTLLPLAVGIAISPVPIIAVTLLLVGPRAVPSGLAFAVGWIVGVVALSCIALLLVGAAPQDPSGERPWIGVVSIVLGALLVAVGIGQQTGTRRRSRSAALPPWMARVDGMSVRAAVTLGLGLSALNPKNLTLGLTAGAVVGQAGDSVPAALALAVFALLASSTVVGPVLARVLAGHRLDPALRRVRDWLTVNNRTIMTVLATVIGVVLIGQGLGEL